LTGYTFGGFFALFLLPKTSQTRSNALIICGILSILGAVWFSAQLPSVSRWIARETKSAQIPVVP
jgi:hypothetical protein